MGKKGKPEEPARITVIQIDSPPDEALAQELWSHCEQINYDTEIRAVVITGAGLKRFCTGGKAQFKQRQTAFSLSDPVAAIRCPVIAAINADAIGAALEIALACDIRITSDKARFAFPYIKYGVVPADGATQRLPRLVGQAKAMELLLTGREIEAGEALDIGLVSRVVADADVMAAAVKLAEELSGKASLAVNYCKEAVLKGLDLTLEQGLRMEGDLYFLLHTTGDRTEGINAFKEKRQPKFKGK